METGIIGILEGAVVLQRELTETLVAEYDHIMHDRYEELAETLKTRRRLEREIAQVTLRISRWSGDGQPPEQVREVDPKLDDFRSELERTHAVAVELGNRAAAEKRSVASHLRKLATGRRAVQTYARQR